MTRPTPPDGTSTVIAGQLRRDDGQDRDLRHHRAAIVALALVALAACAIALRPRPTAPAPVVHVAAPPPCPACPACGACAPSLVCPAPVGRHRGQR